MIRRGPTINLRIISPHFTFAAILMKLIELARWPPKLYSDKPLQVFQMVTTLATTYKIGPAYSFDLIIANHA